MYDQYIPIYTRIYPYVQYVNYVEYIERICCAITRSYTDINNVG